MRKYLVLLVAASHHFSMSVKLIFEINKFVILRIYFILKWRLVWPLHWKLVNSIEAFKCFSILYSIPFIHNLLDWFSRVLHVLECKKKSNCCCSGFHRASVQHERSRLASNWINRLRFGFLAIVLYCKPFSQQNLKLYWLEVEFMFCFFCKYTFRKRNWRCHRQKR